MSDELRDELIEALINHAVLSIVERRVAQARAETAEKIASELEASHYFNCARIARQHAMPAGETGGA